jgi:hypothetical protein
VSNTLVSYQPQNLQQLEEFAKKVTGTSLVSPAYRGKPNDAFVAMLFGWEVAELPPLTSLQFVAVINGKPAFFGDAMPGIALRKGMITDIEETVEGEGDAMTAVCRVTKANGKVAEQRFSVADAKKAKLWGKSGPWTDYPRRMLQWRARSWAIRDAAPHLLFGPSVEELRDIPARHAGPELVKDVTPPVERLGPASAPPTHEPDTGEVIDHAPEPEPERAPEPVPAKARKLYIWNETDQEIGEFDNGADYLARFRDLWGGRRPLLTSHLNANQLGAVLRRLPEGDPRRAEVEGWLADLKEDLEAVAAEAA